VDITMNLTVDELETTTHDDNGHRTYLPNHDDIAFDVASRWEDGDPGQEIVLGYIFAKAVFPFVFTMETAPNRKRFSGNGFAKTFSPAGPLNDAGGLAFSMRGSGVLMDTQS